ncbi:MAG: DUF4097 family beta strand repeat protein [Lysobacter sp.]|nr:DUF4097 family beta strand repeat protein [Lysobacter sp.]
MRPHVLPLALCAVLASPALLAATPIDQTRPLDPRGRVEIDNLKGRIQVRAWNRGEVKLSGMLGDGVERLVVEGGGDHLVVKVQYPKQIGIWRSGHTGPTDLQLLVPLQASLDIDSVSADIDVDGVAPQSLSIDTVSGQVVVAAAPGSTDISSVSGDQRLTLNSRDVKVQSVSGDIDLRGRLGGEVHGETVSGSLSVDSNGGALRQLSTTAVSGDTTLRVALADSGQIKVETVSGDIRLRTPKSLSARLSAKSFSGDLTAPGAKVRKEEYGPGSSLDQRYGDGAGEIRLETFSGDADLSFE